MIRRLEETIRADICGSADAVGFGRGGTPKETGYVGYKKADISGSADGVGFGRGGTPKETGYVGYKKEGKSAPRLGGYDDSRKGK